MTTAPTPSNGMLLIISGPSGVGKTTIAHQIIKQLGATFSVSMTTRPQTSADVEGKDYYFVTAEKFLEHRDRGELLEWAEVFGHFYGTPTKPVEKALAKGHLMLLEIDVQGALEIKDQRPDTFAIFILPPNEKQLLKRLRDRDREDEETIQKRFAKAKDEIDMAKDSKVYDLYLVNDDLQEAITHAICAIRDEWLKRRSSANV